MDNVINQSTVINGEKSNMYIGKKFDGYIASGYSVFIGCSGTVQISMEEAKLFTLINCPNLIVENPYGNNVPVIRDGYAIGDYLFTANANPAAKYGGYWEEVPNGTFLMAAGAGGTVDQTGGEAIHTLTLNEMPEHGYHLPYYQDGSTRYIGNSAANKLYLPVESLQTSSHLPNVPRGWCVVSDNEVVPGGDPLGDSQPHNNLPPYRTAHIFKRIKDPTTGNL